MPVTYVTAVIGSLALAGIPPFAGFFSKDAIIEAVHLSQTPGAGYAYFCVLIGVFVTALYSFRMFFLVFHTEERMDEHTRAHLHESPLVVTVPLVLLAIPSVVIGGLFVGPMLFGGLLDGAVVVSPERDVLGQLGAGFHGVWGMILHGVMAPPFWLAMAGVAVAWFVYTRKPIIAERIQGALRPVYNLLDRKYYFDEFNDRVFAAGGRGLGRLLWRYGDETLIDGMAINGTASAVGRLAGIMRWIQSGYLYHYAFAMIIGLLAMLTWLLVG